MTWSVEHQAFVPVPPLHEGCPPHPPRVKATSPGFAHPVWALAIAGWFYGNEGFRNAWLRGKNQHQLPRCRDARVSGRAGTTSCSGERKLQDISPTVGLYCHLCWIFPVFRGKQHLFWVVGVPLVLGAWTAGSQFLFVRNSPFVVPYSVACEVAFS